MKHDDKHLPDERAPMAYNKFLELLSQQFPHCRVSVADNGEIIVGTFWKMDDGDAVPMVLDEAEVGTESGIPEWQHMIGVMSYAKDQRVRATMGAKGIRSGTDGTVADVDRGDGYVLVQWEGSNSGPMWHRPSQIHKIGN